MPPFTLMSAYRVRHLHLASGADSEHCGRVKPGVWLALAPPWTITVHTDQIWTRGHQDYLSKTSFMNSLVLAGFLLPSCLNDETSRSNSVSQRFVHLTSHVVFDLWIFFHFHCGVVFNNVKYLYILFRTWQRKCFSFNKDLFYKRVFWGCFVLLNAVYCVITNTNYNNTDDLSAIKLRKQKKTWGSQLQYTQHIEKNYINLTVKAGLKFLKCKRKNTLQIYLWI